MIKEQGLGSPRGPLSQVPSGVNFYKKEKVCIFMILKMLDTNTLDGAGGEVGHQSELFCPEVGHV